MSDSAQAIDKGNEHGHTPGPWRVADSADVRGEWSCHEDTEPNTCWQPIANADGRVIALVVDAGESWSGRDSFDADARLIAAAPELLKACQQALYALKGREHDQFLRDAIAKATQP